MKAHINEEKKVLVHGGMKYRCESCGKSWFMNLEVGVEDFGKHGRPHQPAPFMIPCDCGGFAQDISGYIPLPDVRPLLSGMQYFAYDKSGKENACGQPCIYQPDLQKECTSSLTPLEAAGTQAV